MAVWPNGSRTRPTLSSLWKEYDGKPAPEHFGLDMHSFKYNCAIDDGVISKIGWNTFGGGGREIYLTLANGDVILYYHNALAALVRAGQSVVAGQRLGVQSDSGKAYGRHLHIEVWKGGYRSRRVNPLTYITALVGSTTAGGNTKLFPETEQDSDMRSIKHETTGEHALVGEFTFMLMNAGFANPEAKVWNPEGVHILVSDAEWRNIEYLASQNAKRLAVNTAAPAVIDYAKLAALIKVPTAVENGKAARDAIIK